MLFKMEPALLGKSVFADNVLDRLHLMLVARRLPTVAVRQMRYVLEERARKFTPAMCAPWGIPMACAQPGLVAAKGNADLYCLPTTVLPPLPTACASVALNVKMEAALRSNVVRGDFFVPWDIIVMTPMNVPS